MRAVLMAGGSGTRLRPLTCDMPKPMVPILNRPIAEHIINLLRQHGIREAILTLHYLPDIMRDYFQDGSDFDMTITYAVEEDQPLGTAGCVKNIAELLSDTFLVISGDCLTDFDLSAAIAFHQRKRSKATLILTRVPNPLEFGVVITDRNGRIQRFLEKPTTSEIFSDTVNTGTYILEPEVLDYLPENRESDFSKELFPLLLDKGEPLYGYVASGYWCDVGHLDAYRDAQYDALQKKIDLYIDYEERSPGFWVGQGTFVDKTAKIEPPVLVGHHSRIGPRAVLRAGTVIGDNTIVGADAYLDRAVVWNGVLLGEEVHLEACAIARGARVDRRARLLEGAIVGSLSAVGEEATVNPQIRIWPSKQIEPGATLNMNLIWGSIARRNLFNQRGVSGLANIDITPEFAVKLGASFGSTVGVGSHVSVSRDQRSISRMVTRSLVSGLMSVGVHVQNLEATAIPLARAVAPTLPIVGGIHVRAHPERSDSLLVEFFDRKGINVPKAKEKKIEGAFFKEDIRRVPIADIGAVIYPTQVLDTYSTAFEKYLNVDAIGRSGAKIVIDYVYAVSGAILPQLLAKFGSDAVVLNASLKQIAPNNNEREDLLRQLGQVVKALKAAFGVQISANGEQLILVDEAGLPIRGEMLAALMASLMLAAYPGSTVVVPIHVSSAIDAIARRYNARVVRTKVNPTALMETCHTNANAVLGGSAETGFIFPRLHPGFDAMYCVAKLIEMLSLQRRTLSQVRADLPQVCHKRYSMRCPWMVKGALMRYLVETHAQDRVELIDGIRIFDRSPDRWVLVLPDAGEPLVHLFANGEDRTWVDRVLWSYRTKIQEFIDLEGGAIASSL